MTLARPFLWTLAEHAPWHLHRNTLQAFPCESYDHRHLVLQMRSWATTAITEIVDRFAARAGRRSPIADSLHLTMWLSNQTGRVGAKEQRHALRTITLADDVRKYAALLEYPSHPNRSDNEEAFARAVAGLLIELAYSRQRDRTTAAARRGWGARCVAWIQSDRTWIDLISHISTTAYTSFGR